MKQILTFRCASSDVMDKLFKRIGEQANVICYVQENALEEYKARYPYVTFISIHETYFDYDKFCKLADISQTRFDQIFIPSSTRHFNGFDEIFKIAEMMKCHELIMFNCEGRERKEHYIVWTKVLEWIKSKIVACYIGYVDRHYPEKYHEI